MMEIFCLVQYGLHVCGLYVTFPHKILGLNLIMKDKRVYIEPKNAFIFLKDLQVTVFENRTLLEPKTDGVADQNRNCAKSVLSCAEDWT